jgi:hypothetical protein
MHVSAHSLQPGKRPMDEREIDPDEFKPDYTELMSRKRSGE